MKDLSLETTVELNNGVKIPQLGLGTYLATGDRCYRAIRHAIKIRLCIKDTKNFDILIVQFIFQQKTEVDKIHDLT